MGALCVRYLDGRRGVGYLGEGLARLCRPDFGPAARYAWCADRPRPVGQVGHHRVRAGRPYRRQGGGGQAHDPGAAAGRDGASPLGEVDGGGGAGVQVPGLPFRARPDKGRRAAGAADRGRDRGRRNGRVLTRPAPDGSGCGAADGGDCGAQDRASRRPRLERPRLGCRCLLRRGPLEVRQAEAQEAPDRRADRSRDGPQRP